MPVSKILVAEDDADIRLEVVESLALRDYVCTAVINGAQAQEALTHNAYDLIITDFRMPVMDGVSLLNWCRYNGKHLPVVFMSADTYLLSREKVALDDCCASLLQKPFTLRALYGAVEAGLCRDHARHCGPAHARASTHNRGTKRTRGGSGLPSSTTKRC